MQDELDRRQHNEQVMAKENGQMLDEEVQNPDEESEISQAENENEILFINQQEAGIELDIELNDNDEIQKQFLGDVETQDKESAERKVNKTLEMLHELQKFESKRPKSAFEINTTKRHENNEEAASSTGTAVFDID